MLAIGVAAVVAVGAKRAPPLNSRAALTPSEELVGAHIPEVLSEFAE